MVDMLPVLGWVLHFNGYTTYMVLYGFIASVLPVWLLLAPRYLPSLKSGWFLVWRWVLSTWTKNACCNSLHWWYRSTGSLFPFLFITIACGAISMRLYQVVQHQNSSITKLIDWLRRYAYGVFCRDHGHATVLDPGVYFAINAPAAVQL